MITEIEHEKYNRKLELSSWVYSATALGLMRFMDFAGIDYEIKDKDTLLYKYEDIDLGCKGQYLKFVEEYFGTKLKCVELKYFLKSLEHKNKEDVDNEMVKYINSSLKPTSPTVIKNTFKGKKYPDCTIKELLETYYDNEEKIVFETFKNAIEFGYAKFMNRYLFSQKEMSQNISRIKGHYIDKTRKIKSAAYRFDHNTLSTKDYIEFDYIPFAFSKSSEAFFINNNIYLNDLKEINDRLNSRISGVGQETKSRKELFFNTSYTSNLITHNIEIIKISVGKNENYETIYIRNNSINMFKQISNLIKNGDENLEKALNINIKMSKGKEAYWINIMEAVTSSIINQNYLDNLIEISFSKKNEFVAKNLIKINNIIYKEMGRLKDSISDIESAKLSARTIANKLEKNKISTYRNKLLSCIISKNYNKFIEVMLQLYSYSGTRIYFLTDLIEDFESNKNLAYAFIANLNDYKHEKKGENK